MTILEIIIPGFIGFILGVLSKKRTEKNWDQAQLTMTKLINRVSELELKSVEREKTMLALSIKYMELLATTKRIIE